MDGVTGTATNRQPAMLSTFLEGLEFPVSREEVILYAEDRNAPPEFLDMLDEALTDDTFRSASELVICMGQVI